LRGLIFERVNLYLRTSLFQGRSGFRFNLSDQAKLGPLIVKVCKCFTTEKEIVRYNQIITRIAGYQALNLKNRSCKLMAMNPKTAVFRRLKQNLSTDRHDRAAGKLCCPHISFSPMTGGIKIKDTGRVKL